MDHPANVAAELPGSVPRPTLRRPRSSVLGGVCAGLAEHLGWPVGRIRLGFVILTAAGGSGILFYAWLWAMTPVADPGAESRAGANADDVYAQSIRRRVPVAWVLFGAGCVAVLIVLATDFGQRTAVAIAFVATAWAVALLAGAVGWDQLIDAREGIRTRARSGLLRILSGAMLLVLGLILSTISAVLGGLWTWPLVILATFAGAAVLLGPWALGLWRELIAERTARVREEQRAEIAAHLHDSVLQTLALIQNRAGASSEVARIARAQERELRDWLYAGDAVNARDLATEVRDAAAALELDWPVRIEVVAIGEPVLGGVAADLAAASREAMLNAARHAGGDVAVFIETSADEVDVFVRDRGPGFTLDAVPERRLGVRESILGRMRRAGGSATVRPGVGGIGTEVHLHAEHGRTPSEHGAGGTAT